MLLNAAIVLLLPALALCQSVDLRPYDQTAREMFETNDVNGDGVYAYAEIHQNFMGYDTNSDGRVSRFEYTNLIDQNLPHLHEFSHALYDIYDVDGDHFLDEHDFRNYHRLMDSNSDSSVSDVEFIRWWTIILEDLEHTHLPNN